MPIGYNGNVKAEYSKIRNGIFHQWGLDGLESEDGNIMVTVAIVEDDETGTMHKVEVEKIRFTEPFEVKQA